MKNQDPNNPWIASFSSMIKPVVSKERDKYLSIASVEKLKKFIPEIDAARNSDLVPIAFNAYVANRVNANDDVCSTHTAISMQPHFINKPINIEHDRNNIVGCILKSGFSKFGSDDPYGDDNLLEFLMENGQYEPFNSTLGGVLWKNAGHGIASYIEEAGDPSSSRYNSISASWEVSFSEFYILALPEGKKNYSEGTVITDDNLIEEMMGNLRGFGGDGYYKGEKLYRLISGDVTPLGIGLTENPAADVKGVITKKGNDNNEKIEEKYMRHEEDTVAEKFTKTLKNSICDEVNANNIQKTVKNNKDNLVMDITNIKDITDDKLQSGEIKASVVSNFIEKGLEQASEEYSEEKNRLQKSIAEAQKLTEDLKKDNEEIKSKLENAEKAVAELTSQIQAKEIEETFNSRMQVIAEKFELTDSQEKAIAKEIKSLDSDEAFAEYLEKVSLFVSEKSDKKNDEVVASQDKVVSDAIDNGETKKEAVASQTSEGESLAEKYKKHFSVKVDKGTIKL